MTEVLFLATTFPSVVFTVLLGVVLVYWAFVMVGAIDLGQGGDGALDGLADAGAGAAKGALEGAAKGALEGAAKGALEGSAKGALEHAAGGGDGDADFDLDAEDVGPLAALLSALRLRTVPATVVLSLIVIFSWLVSVVAMQAADRIFPALRGAVAWAAFFGSPVLALPLTMLAVRPLASVFTQKKATSRADLVGKTCIVRTGKVTSSFGEGTVEDGGAGLVVRLRVEGDRELRRGEAVLIVDWDADREAFLVEPMKDVLAEPK